MSEYYAVIRTTDHLAHYGVKGMKWGVRKAIEKNNIDSLSRHYVKAANKLETLKKHADKKGQKQAAKDNAEVGAALLGLGALGGLASYGVVKGQLAAQKALLPNDPYRLVVHPAGLYGTSALMAGTGAGLLGSSVASAYRATKRGNKKAIEKYKRFKKEMDTAFKGQDRKRLEQHFNTEMLGLSEHELQKVNEYQNNRKPKEYKPSGNVTTHSMPQQKSKSKNVKRR